MKSKRRIVRATIITAIAVFFAYLFGLAGQSDFDSGEHIFAMMRMLIYFTLFTTWTLRVQRTVQQQATRRYLFIAGLLMMFWLYIRTLKQEFALSPTEAFLFAMRHLPWLVYAALVLLTAAHIAFAYSAAKETTPAASFTASSTSGELTGVSAGTLSIVKQGNGTTTTDSDAQEITVTKASAPTGVTGVACTNSSNNGKLTGVTAEMEYQKFGNTAWTACGGTEVTNLTNLTNGAYYVRMEVSGAVLASANQTVTIDAYSGGSSSGGGSAAHAVSTAETTNGTISVSPQNAAKDATVTITTTPDKGWTLETLRDSIYPLALFFSVRLCRGIKRRFYGGKMTEQTVEIDFESCYNQNAVSI